MDLTLLARPYAIAAYETAVETSALANWSEALTKLAAIVAEPMVQACLFDPNLTAAELSDVCIALTKNTLSDAVCNFVRLLAEADKLTCLPEILKLFELLKAKDEQLVTVQVTSAVPLSDDYKQKLANALKTRLQKTPVLQCQEDPSLIGGILITAGDTVFDGSVLGQIKRFEHRITE